jgi:hypothetical protein
MTTDAVVSIMGMILLIAKNAAASLMGSYGCSCIVDRYL